MAVKIIWSRNLCKLLMNNTKCAAVNVLNREMYSKVPVNHTQYRVLETSMCRRWFSLSSATRQQEVAEEDGNDDEKDSKPVDIVQTVDLETSIEYMNSEAYKVTYGAKLVWEPYKRNHKGPTPPPKTRKMCIRKNVLATANPCPICRDQYLLVHPQNLTLLKQFVSPQTGKVISYEKTGVCQQQHKRILVAVQQAWDLGLLEMPLPIAYYNYADYDPRPRRKRHNNETIKSREKQTNSER